MHKVVRSIILAFVTAAYLTTTCATAIRLLQPSYTSHDTPSVAASTGASKEIPRPSYVPRRHIPLVKTFSSAPDAAIAVLDYPCERTDGGGRFSPWHACELRDPGSTPFAGRSPPSS